MADRLSSLMVPIILVVAGPCDGTTILQKFIAADVQDAVIAVIADPESVAQAVEAGRRK